MALYVDNYGRTWSSVNINGKKTITFSNNVLSIQSEDGMDYNLIIPVGTYETEYTLHQSELVDKIRELINTNGFPIECKLGGIHTDEKKNVIVLKMTNGKAISSIKGSFATEFIN